MPKVPLQVQPCQGELTWFVHPLLLSMGLNITLVSQTLPLAGRLQHFLNNWKLLTQDQFILKMIEGVLIPFVEPPRQEKAPSQTFHNHLEGPVIEQEIAEMLQKGAIQVVSPLKGEFISTVFLVKKKVGGNRPAINLKLLNSFIVYQHFKMEGLDLLKHLIQKETG